MPFLMAETPIIKAGMNGFYPWANKEKIQKTDLKSQTISSIQTRKFYFAKTSKNLIYTVLNHS